MGGHWGQDLVAAGTGNSGGGDIEVWLIGWGMGSEKCQKWVLWLGTKTEA